MPRSHHLLAALFLGATLAAPAAAQPRYLLQLGPRTGDTLHLEFDQRTEVLGAARAGAAAAPRSLMGMHIWSRIIAEERLPGAISVIAATDSALVSASDGREGESALPRRAMVVGQMTRFHMAPDGTLKVPDNGTADGRELAQAMSLVPATMPVGAVAIGDRWTREMPVALAGPGDAGKVQAVFRFDSVGRKGELAYLSMRGELAQDSVPAGPPRGTMMRMAGTMTGNLVLDRRRGWVTRSQFLLVLKSVLVPPAGSAAAPRSFTTRVTQQMWVAGGARGAKSR